MRLLTASQKIAQLEHRINQLEKEAGLFDLFNPIKKSLLALTKAIAKDLLRYRVIAKKGDVKLSQEDASHFILEMPVVGLGGSSLRLKVAYHNSTIHVALYDPSNYGYEKTLLFMGGFVPEDSSKARELQNRLREVLTDRVRMFTLLKDLR